MADVTTLSNAILQRIDPSQLSETVTALETLNGIEENSAKTTPLWKGGGGGAGGSSIAKQFLPLQHLEPAGSREFGNEEKPFFAVETFNRFCDKAAATTTSTSFQSPHSGKCYTKTTGVQCQEDLDAFSQLQQQQQQSQSQDLIDIQQEIQTFQKAANEVWDSYRVLYYGWEYSVGSVFVRIADGSSSTDKFAMPSTLQAWFGIAKHEPRDHATWQSVHCVTIGKPNMEDKTCEYKIDSAVWCTLQQTQGGTMDRTNAENLKLSTHVSPATSTVAAILHKETNRQCKLLGIITSTAAGPTSTAVSGATASSSNHIIPSAQHIENIGTLIEQIEMDFRSQLERVVFPKAVEVTQGFYRELGKSATVHLMLDEKDGGDNEDSNIVVDHNYDDQQNNTKKKKSSSRGTGMGVGKDMIGDIADSAKSKDSDNVLKTVAQHRETKSNDSTATSTIGTEYTNIRALLKSPIQTPKPTTKASLSINTATPEFINFRDKLKSPTKK